MGDTDAIVTALGSAGYRLTAPRRSVATLIAEQDGHFTATGLVEAARRRNLGVGRATVFRTLEVLEDLGAVERLDLPSGEHAYVGCELAHHHHVVCAGCGRTDPIADAGLRAVVEEVARRTGYRVDDHRLEMFGLCPRCQKREGAAGKRRAAGGTSPAPGRTRRAAADKRLAAAKPADR